MGDAEMMSLNWFRVRWKTKCGKCERELVEGDWAAYSREEKGVLVCKPCGKEEEGEE
jgi:RNase P subunit RPR2